MDRCCHCAIFIRPDGSDIFGGACCVGTDTAHAPWPDLHYVTTGDGRMALA